MTNTTRWQKGFPLPTSLGLCVDEYHAARELRLAMAKEVEEVAEREAELKEHLISNISKSDERGVCGRKYLGKIENKVAAKLSDWPKFTAYIAANDRFDLLEKRPAAKAVKEMWDANETVPGVERVNVPTLSVTKL